MEFLTADNSEFPLTLLHTEEIYKLMRSVSLEDYPPLDNYLRLGDLLDILVESSNIVIVKRGEEFDYKVNHRDIISKEVYGKLFNFYINYKEEVDNYWFEGNDGGDIISLLNTLVFITPTFINIVVGHAQRLLRSSLDGEFEVSLNYFDDEDAVLYIERM